MRPTGADQAGQQHADLLTVRHRVGTALLERRIGLRARQTGRRRIVIQVHAAAAPDDDGGVERHLTRNHSHASRVETHPDKW